MLTISDFRKIATGFVAHGASVYITSRDAKSCNDTVIELNKLGAGSCTAIPANLSQYSEVERLVDEMSKKEKSRRMPAACKNYIDESATELHVLVNNAGVTWGSTLEDFPDEAFSKVLLLNLQRVFTLTQKLLPLLDAAVIRTAGNEKSFDDPARVINIGSVDGEKVPL